jgi:hypothetical protein
MTGTPKTKSNTSAALVVGPDGKPVIHHLLDWQPTPVLRYLVPNRATTKPPVLQQMFGSVSVSTLNPKSRPAFFPDHRVRFQVRNKNKPGCSLNPLHARKIPVEYRKYIAPQHIAAASIGLRGTAGD